MDPYRFEWAGAVFEVDFERGADGWLARIRRDGDAFVHLVAFPHGPGYAPDDVRGSLIAGCEAAVEKLSWPGPTRH